MLPVPPPPVPPPVPPLVLPPVPPPSGDAPRGGATRGEASSGDAPRGAGCDYGGEEEVRGSVRGVTPPTDSYVFLSSSSSSCVSVAAVAPPLSHRDVRDGQRETLGAG